MFYPDRQHQDLNMVKFLADKTGILAGWRVDQETGIWEYTVACLKCGYRVHAKASEEIVRETEYTVLSQVSGQVHEEVEWSNPCPHYSAFLLTKDTPEANAGAEGIRLLSQVFGDRPVMTSELRELVGLVVRMRKAQKSYFKERTQATLELAKNQEDWVDCWIAAYEAGQQHLALFSDQEKEK